MENLRIILEEAGSSLEKVLTITAYLLDMEDYAGFNAVYKSCFKGDLPARTCIRAAELPFGTRVEVTATAYI
jgi:2-iminobutanoate/2-iminopropanoate deaminase